MQQEQPERRGSPGHGRRARRVMTAIWLAVLLGLVWPLTWRLCSAVWQAQATARHVACKGKLQRIGGALSGWRAAGTATEPDEPTTFEQLRSRDALDSDALTCPAARNLSGDRRRRGGPPDYVLVSGLGSGAGAATWLRVVELPANHGQRLTNVLRADGTAEMLRDMDAWRRALAETNRRLAQRRSEAE